MPHHQALRGSTLSTGSGTCFTLNGYFVLLLIQLHMYPQSPVIPGTSFVLQYSTLLHTQPIYHEAVGSYVAFIAIYICVLLQVPMLITAKNALSGSYLRQRKCESKERESKNSNGQTEFCRVSCCEKRGRGSKNSFSQTESGTLPESMIFNTQAISAVEGGISDEINNKEDANDRRYTSRLETRGTVLKGAKESRRGGREQHSHSPMMDRSPSSFLHIITHPEAAEVTRIEEDGSDSDLLRTTVREPRPQSDLLLVEPSHAVPVQETTPTSGVPANKDRVTTKENTTSNTITKPPLSKTKRNELFEKEKELFEMGNELFGTLLSSTVTSKEPSSDESQLFSRQASPDYLMSRGQMKQKQKNQPSKKDTADERMTASIYLPVKRFAKKSINNEGKSKTSLHFFEKCLQNTLSPQGSLLLAKQSPKENDANGKEDPKRQTAYSDSVLPALTSVSNLRYSRRVRHEIVAFTGENVEENSQRPYRHEAGRLASFYMSRRVPNTGRFWVTRIAAAGFYSLGNDSSLLRCAFCDLQLEMSVLENRVPLEVHRERSPNCPLVNGRSSNVPLEQRGHISALNFIQGFFGQEGSGNKEASSSRANEQHREETVVSTIMQKDREARGTLSTQCQQLSSYNQPEEPERREINAAVTQTPPAKTGPIRTQHSHVSHSRSEEGGPMGSQSGQMTHHPPAQSRANTAHPVESRQIGTQNSLSAPQTLPTEAQAFRTQQAPATHTPTVAAESLNILLNPLPFQTARPINDIGQQASGNNESIRSSQTPPFVPGEPTGQEAANHDRSPAPLAPPPASEEPMRQVVTYAQLGIYTQEPRRADYAIATTRMTSFSHWPHPHTHTAEEMAEAGFYYFDQGDLVRCFYCKGGLKSWAPHLRPWVEHARFFPKCPFVGQVKGQEFIDVVQDLKEKQENISDETVEQLLTTNKQNTQSQENGGATGGVTGEENESFEQRDLNELNQAADDLEIENKEIADERTCKICQTSDVSILFLPCGHLVSCAQCAPALRTCAICRTRVKGRVRVIDK